MYTKYVTNATSTQADVLNDVVLILTGTTDVNTLSASCNKALTEIHTTYTQAGWELWDAAAGTNQKVIRAPVYDNPAQYKYVKISTNTASRLSFSYGENWNATTHISTIFTTDTGTAGQAVSYTQSTTIWIHSSARFFRLLTNYGSTYGSQLANTNGSPPIGHSVGVYEYTRWSPWDNSTAGYLNVTGRGCFNSTAASAGYAGVSRYKNFNNVDAAAGTAFNILTTPYGSTSGFVANAQGAKSMQLAPIFCNLISQGHAGGNITEQCNVYACTDITGNPGDEITIGGVTYIYYSANQSDFVGSGPNPSFMLPTVVPKG